MESSGRRDVHVAGAAAGVRRERASDSRKGARRAVRPGPLLLRAESPAEHAAAWICEPRREANCAWRGHPGGNAEGGDAQAAAWCAESGTQPGGVGMK